MSKRVYYVRGKHGVEFLVRAHSPSQAIRKATEGNYVAEVASQDTLIELLARDIPVLNAGAERRELDLPEGNKS